jgi:hypothetical protein
MSIGTYISVYLCGNLEIRCVPHPSHGQCPSCALCYPTPVQACGKKWSIAWKLAVWKKGGIHRVSVNYHTTFHNFISNKVYSNVHSNSHSTIYSYESVYSICENPVYLYIHICVCVCMCVFLLLIYFTARLMQQRIWQDVKRVKAVVADFKAPTVRCCRNWRQHSRKCALELGAAYIWNTL